MAAGLLADRAELEALFDELARELSRLGVRAEVVMVGGAWLLWHTQRSATRDVDSARRLAAAVSEAVVTISARHDLARDWLNDHAAAFWPAGATFDDCDIVFERDALIVRAPSADVVFLMKLYRADPQDREDMISLWPLCVFETPDDAARALRAAYPHAPDDEHLADYIADIARDAT
jgi:hypothetical protein